MVAARSFPANFGIAAEMRFATNLGIALTAHCFRLPIVMILGIAADMSFASNLGIALTAHCFGLPFVVNLGIAAC
jgi:hypothetical protein